MELVEDQKTKASQANLEESLAVLQKEARKSEELQERILKENKDLKTLLANLADEMSKLRKKGNM